MAFEFSTRLDTLGTRMKELHSNTLTYTRKKDGVTTTATVTNFTPETCDIQEIAQHGIVLVTAKLQDFIFDTSDISAFSPAVPETGDTLTWGSNVFEVFSIGEEMFKYTTSSRLRIRVHTQQTT